MAAASAGGSDNAAATAAGMDTGGSARGDFGPPQGEPVRAVLTSPPNVPPPVNRTQPAKVMVEPAGVIRASTPSLTELDAGFMSRLEAVLP